MKPYFLSNFKLKELYRIYYQVSEYNCFWKYHVFDINFKKE